MFVELTAIMHVFQILDHSKTYSCSMSYLGTIQVCVAIIVTCALPIGPLRKYKHHFSTFKSQTAKVSFVWWCEQRSSPEPPWWEATTYMVTTARDTEITEAGHCSHLVQIECVRSKVAESVP